MNVLFLLAAAITGFLLVAVVILLERSEFRRSQGCIDGLNRLIVILRAERDEARRETAKLRAGMRRLITVS